MSNRDHWKSRDRPCPPCPKCGEELYEQFWGNGGWAKVSKATDEVHRERDCIARKDALLSQLVGALLGVEWDGYYDEVYDMGFVCCPSCTAPMPCNWEANLGDGKRYDVDLNEKTKHYADCKLDASLTAAGYPDQPSRDAARQSASRAASRRGDEGDVTNADLRLRANQRQ